MVNPAECLLLTPKFHFIFSVWFTDFNTTNISVSKREPYQAICSKFMESATEYEGRVPNKSTSHEDSTNYFICLLKEIIGWFAVNVFIKRIFELLVKTTE